MDARPGQRELNASVRPKLAPFVENIAESTTACLVTMVQGNLLALSMGHWIIASRTGVIAGVLASAVMLLARAKSRSVIATLLGAVTGVVDFFVHPGQFGPAAAEAIATGLGAMLLSYLIGAGVTRFRRTQATV